MSYPPSNYGSQVSITTTSTSPPSAETCWIGDGNINNEEESQWLCYDITLIILEVICIVLGFVVIGVDWVLNNLCVVWEIFFFWGAISTALHLIGLIIFTKNQKSQKEQKQLLQSQPSQNNLQLQNQQQGGEGGRLDKIASNYLDVGVTGKWNVGKILMFPFYVHANVKHIIILLMIIVGFFACLRSLVAYPYEFSPGMYDYNYSSCLTSDINCDYSYEDVFGSTERGVLGIVILTVGFILYIIIQVLIHFHKKLGLKSLGANFLYRGQGLGESLVFIIPIICFLHNFRNWGGPFLHWTLYYENSLESSSKWHDGRHIGARGVIAVLFLIVGIFGLICAVGSVAIIYMKFGRNNFKVIHVAYMIYSVVMDILMFINAIFTLLSGIVHEVGLYNRIGGHETITFKDSECNTNGHEYCSDSTTGPFAVLYLLALIVVAWYTAVYYAIFLRKGAQGLNRAKISFNNSYPDEYKTSTTPATTVIPTVLGASAPAPVAAPVPVLAYPPQPKYLPQPGYLPRRPAYFPEQQGYPPQQYYNPLGSSQQNSQEKNTQ